MNTVFGTSALTLTSHEASTIVQMRKPRHRKVKYLFQGTQPEEVPVVKPTGTEISGMEGLTSGKSPEGRDI